MSWITLRDHLRADIARQIDDGIRDHPDPEMRAILAANRERILDLAVDQLELAALRRALAEQEHVVADREPAIRLNGNGSGKRVVRVQ